MPVWCHSSAVELFLPLLVLLIMTRACGEVAVRLGQPALVGEVAAGLAVGALWFLIGDATPNYDMSAHLRVVDLVAELGIFFLILLAGVEMQPQEIYRHSGPSFAVAAGGMVLPLAGGFLLTWVFLPDTSLAIAQALAVGVALSTTAVPVATRVLMDFGILHHPVGRTIVSAAIFDDVLGLAMLAVLSAVIESGHLPDLQSLAMLLLRVASFFVLTVFFGARFYPWVSRHLGRAHSVAAGFSTLLVTALAFAVLAEMLGMHFILGPFVAGLYFEKSRVGRKAYREIKETISVITSAFLAPIFFASIGLRLDLAALKTMPLFLLLLLVVAFAGKLIGAAVPARLTGHDTRESLTIGIGMGGRGAVGLVVASLAYEAGIFQARDSSAEFVGHLFSALVFVAVLTTIATPILLRRIAPGLNAKGHKRHTRR